MTSIINVFKRLYFQNVKTPLGRWNINNYKETTLKIDYANEDNCGISSNKNIIQNIKIHNTPLEMSVIYNKNKTYLSGWKIHNYPHKDNYGMSSRDYRIITSIQKEKQHNYNKYMFMMGYESVHN